MAVNIEIQGLEKLDDLFKMLPKEVRASVIRNIARKASSRIVREARHLVPQLTGKTAKSINVLKVTNQRQPYVEVGFKGASLGYIYLTGAKNRRTKKGANRGDIAKIPNPFHRAASRAGTATKKEINVDIAKVIAKAIKQKGYRSK